MDLRKNRRAVSSEVLKIAAAVMIAFAVFAMMAGFALGPKESGAEAEETGRELLNATQDAAFKILEYGND